MSSLQRSLRDAFFDELRFYRLHHKHPLNWRLHAVCVPVEAISALVLTAYLSSALPTFLSTLMALYASLLDPPRTLVPGALVTVCLGPVAEAVFLWSGDESACWVAALLHISSWALQVGVGHRLIEGNTPGMVELLTANSVVLSPLLAVHPYEAVVGEGERVTGE